MSQKINLAVIAGDGIGPEVTDAALTVLDKVLDGEDVQIERTDYDLGASRWHRTGEVITDDERSEEHTSELQSRFDLVCRLLLEKKKNLGPEDSTRDARDL